MISPLPPYNFVYLNFIQVQLLVKDVRDFFAVFIKKSSSVLSAKINTPINNVLALLVKAPEMPVKNAVLKNA